MPGDAHLVDGLALDREGLDALGDDGLGPQGTAGALHHDLVAVFDAAHGGQLGAHLAEHLGFGLKEPGGVAGHDACLPVLGHPVGGADKRETRIAHGVRLGRTRELERRGVVQLFGEGMAADGALERLIVLGQGAVVAARAEDLAHAVGGHDERILALRGIGHGRPGTVRHIAHPLAVLPGDDRLVGLVGLAVGIDRGPVVQDAAVDRPGPGPARIKPDGGLHGRLGLVPPGGHVLVGVGAAIHPGARTGGAVGLQQGEARHGVAGFERLVRVADLEGLFRQEGAVDALGHLVGIEGVVGGHVPVQVLDRIGEGAAFLGVQGPDLFVELVDDVAVGLGVAGRGLGGVAPLHPAARVGDRAFLFKGDGARQEEDLGLDLFGVHTRAFPEGARLGFEDVDRDHPVELGHGLTGFVGVGGAGGRILAPGEKALESPAEHDVEQRQPGVILARFELGQVVVGRIQVLLGIHGFEETGHVFWPVAPPVDALRILGDGGVLVVELLECRHGRRRGRDVAGQNVEQQALVRGALDVGLAAKRVDAAAGHTHVAQKQLDDGHGPDVLHADGVLGLAHGIEHGAGLLRFARGGVGLVDPLQVGHRRAADGGNGLHIVAIIVLLQNLEDAPGIAQGGVFFDDALFVPGKAPGRLVVRPFLGVVAGEQAVLEIVLVAQDEGSVGVIDNVIFEIKIVGQDVPDQSAKKRNIRTGAQPGEDIGMLGGPGKARIHMDDGRAPILGPKRPLKGNRMVFGGIAADDENAITVDDVDPVIGHRAASERLCQSRNSGAVSDTGLVLDVGQPHGSQHGLVDPAFLVVQGRGTDRGDALAAIDRTALGVLGHKARVPRVLDLAGDAVERPVPGLLFPLLAVRRAVKHLENPAVVLAELVMGGAFGAQRAFVDGMVGIALDVDHPPLAVLVRAGDQPASHRAIAAHRGGLLGEGEFGRLGLGPGRAQVEAESAERGHGRGRARDFQELTPVPFHSPSPCR